MSRRKRARVTHVTSGSRPPDGGLPDYHEGDRLIAASDLQKAVYLFGAWLIAWSVPERFWLRVCSSLTKLTTLAFPGQARTRARAIPPRLVNLLGGPTAVDALAKAQAHYFSQCVAFLRDYRPGGWRPEIRLTGREHIERALERGQGAILYSTEFVYSHLVVRMALQRAGLPLTCLSRPTSPFSDTRFGIRVLNPIKMHVENRYGAEQVVLHAKSPPGAALEILGERLRQDAVVMIYAGHLGRRTVDVPFLGGRIRLATGPLWLAQTSGAAILPTFAVQTGPGRFDVVIEPALEVSGPDGQPRSVEGALTDYAPLLEAYVERYPDQWFGWEGGLVLWDESLRR